MLTLKHVALQRHDALLLTGTHLCFAQYCFQRMNFCKQSLKCKLHDFFIVLLTCVESSFCHTKVLGHFYTYMTVQICSSGSGWLW